MASTEAIKLRVTRSFAIATRLSNLVGRFGWGVASTILGGSSPHPKIQAGLRGVVVASGLILARALASPAEQVPCQFGSDSDAGGSTCLRWVGQESFSGSQGHSIPGYVLCSGERRRRRVSPPTQQTYGSQTKIAEKSSLSI
ncbi:hypothetical protein DENSPDRAFT_175364 [Dentipellis sp. KUC8613]|nr:hypothetical protein DENSPDRAFT_175364 [Dentipellis sp. KUC8613]